MRYREYSADKEKTIVLIHPSLVLWDYFEYVIPYLEKDYRLIIPILPGYDPQERSDFTSVEEVAKDLADILLEKGIEEIECIYGCSMGGSIVLRFLADGKIKTKAAIIDGGITPYRLPYLITRFIALKDFLLICLGKWGGIKILEKAFSTDEYSKEDLEYVLKVLNMISYKTIWNTFDSCNNYVMPDPINIDCKKIVYWYADGEKKDRKKDISYIKEKLPQVVFKEFENIGHAGLALLKPETMALELKELLNQGGEESVAF
ncbi:MAG: alpha/beta fold hydrolase [Erysipelotrichaceae bacterium]|nr:alpha/beta fold hydrolase [Erysipelotrichaceae bacterium]